MSLQNIIIKDSEGETIVQKSFVTEVSDEVNLFITSQITSYNLSIPICLRNRGRKSELFVHYGHRNMHFFVQMKESKNGDIMSAVYFLQETAKVLEKFLGGQLTPKLLKDNVPLVMEILGELVDSGEVLTTDPQILTLFIQDGKATVKSLTDAQVTIQVTKQTAYRPNGITYTKNELFIDINETLSCVQDQAGNLLSSDVKGELHIKSKLSGMPDCSLQLNDRLSNAYSQKGLSEGSPHLHNSSIVSLDGVQLHHCARPSDFVEKRQLNFIPPDGQFTLMRYTVGRSLNAPLTVRVLYTPSGKSEVRCVFSLRPRYTAQQRAEKLKLQIPLPADVQKLNLKTAIGLAKQSKCGRFIEWLIKSLPGESGNDVELEAEFSAIQWDSASWKKPNIHVSFCIQNLLASGVEVLGIKIVSQEGYDVQKWFKAKTVTGDYVIKW